MIGESRLCLRAGIRSTTPCFIPVAGKVVEGTRNLLGHVNLSMFQTHQGCIKPRLLGPTSRLSESAGSWVGPKFALPPDSPAVLMLLAWESLR